MGPVHKLALQMSEVELKKRFDQYTYKKTNSKGDTPKFTPKGEKATGKGIKRDFGGKSIAPGSQSSTDTTTTEVEAPVDCTKCGGKHAAETVKKWGTKFVCPFEHHNHPHVNMEAKAFLNSTMGKPYRDHPWEQEDQQPKKMVPMHRLKHHLRRRKVRQTQRASYHK
jgi:hypothetical protein